MGELAEQGLSRCDCQLPHAVLYESVESCVLKKGEESGMI